MKYNITINKLLATTLKCATTAFNSYLDSESFTVVFREGLSLKVPSKQFITGNMSDLYLNLSLEMIKRLLSSQSDAQISVTIENTSVLFKEGRSRTSFPLVSEAFSEELISSSQAISNELRIPAKYLLYALKQIMFALPKKGTAETLNTFMFSAKGTKLRIAATDSFRYASQIIECSPTAKEEFSIHSYVLIKLIPLIQNAIENNEDEEIVFSFYTGIDKMKISSSIFTAVCSYTNTVKIDGEKLFSETRDYHEINNSEFRETMKRIIPFVSSTNTQVTLNFVEKNIVKISYKSASVEIDETVSVHSNNSAYRELISFNANFLYEMAETETEQLKIGIKNNRSPVYVFADNQFEGLLCPTITK